jgi:integrase
VNQNHQQRIMEKLAGEWASIYQKEHKKAPRIAPSLVRNPQKGLEYFLGDGFARAGGEQAGYGKIAVEVLRRCVRTLPFIPLESELDQLISGANRKTATFLQLLKETAMRSGEAWRLRWTDVNLKNGTVTLNEPEKYGKPRMFKVSSTLLAMLQALPKNSDFIFEGSLPVFRKTFRKYRARMTVKLKNPRFKKITFHTFRHWKATTEYHKTKDILHIMEMLGHRDIKTTLIYTQLVSFESDEYNSSTAKTTEEAKEVVEAGFEYICTTPQDVMLFRKRK